MIDIKSFEDGVKEIGAEKLKAWISSGSTLSVAFDIDGRRFTEEELEDIKANRNLDKAGTFTPVRAIVCERADLRTVPYGGPMLKAAGDTYYDRLQETELVLGMPVWVLHESSDGLFYYVQSYFYRGWVSRETVAAAKSEEEWMYFADPESFVVVTDALVKLGGKSVDMGVKLPAVKSEDGGKYTVTIPAADAEAFLYGKMRRYPLCLHMKGSTVYDEKLLYSGVQVRGHDVRLGR